VKVIGAGFGRTGTMSLKVALETLGFDPCYHMTEVFVHPEHAGFWISAWRREPADWDGVLGEYEAAVDWPACTFYEELMERHPDAKVILSVRDPERWYESVRNTIYELSVVIPRHPIYRIGHKLLSFFVFRGPGIVDLASEIIWRGTFDGRFEDRSRLLRLLSALVILVFFSVYVSAQLVAGGILFREVFGADLTFPLTQSGHAIVVVTNNGGLQAGVRAIRR
jgi:hypothetical protein